ncbi:MAG: inositol monophosphatase family protein, partial [Pseudomonadota bacterium]
LPETMRDLSQLMPRTAGVRRFGAAALDLAWVAAGRYDGFWERSLNAWDIAAGILLVQEAGGLVGQIGTVLGVGDPLSSGDILASNANVYDQLNRHLKDT